VDWPTLTGARGTPGSLADFLNNSTLAPSAPFIVQEAEAMIYRRLRHWQMLTSPTTGTMTIGTDSIPVPPDCLEPHLLMITGTNQSWIEQKTIRDVMGQWAYDESGARLQQQPLIYAFNQTNIVFDNPPDQAYPYALVYYQQPAPLSANNPTNFVTTTYPRLLRAACLITATEWTKESGTGSFDRTYWLQVFGDEIAKAQIESDEARRAVQVGAMFIGGGGEGGPPMFSW